jgi:hypothetical protein
LRSGQTIEGNQEFIGQGLSNIAGSFFSGYPSSGSFTRSGVNFEAGGADAAGRGVRIGDPDGDAVLHRAGRRVPADRRDGRRAVRRRARPGRRAGNPPHPAKGKEATATSLRFSSSPSLQPS